MRSYLIWIDALTIFQISELHQYLIVWMEKRKLLAVPPGPLKSSELFSRLLKRVTPFLCICPFVSLHIKIPFQIFYHQKVGENLSNLQAVLLIGCQSRWGSNLCGWCPNLCPLFSFSLRFLSGIYSSPLQGESWTHHFTDRLKLKSRMRPRKHCKTAAACLDFLDSPVYVFIPGYHLCSHTF